jgi:putative FmdB family regulatory protein
MPSYEFECQSCHGTFTLSLSMRDREAGNIQCPTCGDQQLHGEDVEEELTCPSSGSQRGGTSA